MNELELALATIKRVQQDINWMMNCGKLLNPSVFDYLHDAADRLDVEGRVPQNHCPD